jgi:hypothetical protein
VTSEQAGKTLYVVHRIGWVEQYGGGFRKSARKDEEGGKQMLGRGVAAFLDRDRAEAFRRDQEVAASAGKNPFDYAEMMWEMTSIDDDVFADVLLDLGLNPPPKEQDGYREWDGWWDEHKSKLTPEQWAGVWPYLDQLHFYQVVEVPLITHHE